MRSECPSNGRLLLVQYDSLHLAQVHVIGARVSGAPSASKIWERILQNIWGGILHLVPNALRVSHW